MKANNKTNKKGGKIKQKKALVAAVALMGIVAIFGTIAYFNDSLSFTNIFGINDSREEYTEVFDAPSDWQPCQETPKTAVATNKNATPRYARMKYDEYWRLKNSTIPSSDHSTSDLSLTFNNGGSTEKVAVVNLQNTNDWVYKDGWYYYKNALGQNESTNSLLKSVTLNCNMNLVDGVTYSQDGKSGQSTPSSYADAIFHLFITFEMSDEAWDIPVSATLHGEIAARSNNGVDTNVDFSTAATATDGNGNGLNIRSGTEGDQNPVLYFRGEVDDNHVIWGGYCWRIFRTTSTGGTKIVFNGEPTEVNGERQCLGAGGSESVIAYNNVNSFAFHKDGEYGSPADVGYMYGERIPIVSVKPGSSTTYTFSKGIDSISGINYNLKTGTDLSISSKWINSWTNASTGGYYYFCPNGTATCFNPGFILEFNSGSSSQTNIFHLSVADASVNTRADMLEAMIANSTTSNAKTVTEGWFTANNLTSYESDLEDTVFCNDRELGSGSLYHDNLAKSSETNKFNSFIRTYDYTPSLSCATKRDAFTVAETATTNGLLGHRVGLITSDELMLAGLSPSNVASSNYIVSSTISMTMSPSTIGGANVLDFAWTNNIRNINTGNTASIRPVVSLKNETEIVPGGEGTRTNPYVVVGS